VSDPSQIGEAFVRIRPKASATEFERETKQQLGPATKNVGDSLSKDIAQTLTAGAFVAFSATVVRSAAEAEQAVGGTAAVFKDARGEIDAFAQGSAESLGLTEQATRQFSSQIGSALKGYGFSIEDAADTSQKLITKGADLTALFGGTVPEAVTAMSAALRGEFDPLERYGVSLTAAAVASKAVSLGLADSTSQVDGHAKAVATLAIIEEQTADATGQFNRELGTAAGQMSVATAKIGDATDELGSRFLPVVTKGAGAVSAMADAFGALPGPVQAAVAGMVALIALSGPLGKVKGSVQGVVESFKEGGEEAAEFKGKLSALAKTGVVVAGIAAITGGIEAFNAAQDKEVSDFASKLPDPSDIQGYRDAVNESIARQAELSDELNRFTDEGSDASEIPAQLGAAWDFFTNSITGNVSAVGTAKAEYDALTASLPAAKLKAEELTTTVNRLGDELGVPGDKAAELVSKFKGLDITQVPINRLVDVLGRLQRGEIDVQTAAEDLGVGVSTAGDKAADAAKKFDDLKAGLFGLTDAAHAYEDSVEGVADAQRSADRATVAVADAQRSYEQAVRSVGDAQDSYQDSVRSTQDAEERRVDALRSVTDATRALEDAQRALTEAQNGPTESDNLDLEAAELRIAQMRKDLADKTDPTDKRLGEIAIRQAEIDLAERRAEIEGRVAEAQVGVADATDRLSESQRAADDAARAVTDAQESQRDAAVAIADAQYNAGKAYDQVTTAQINAEKASRDIERAKYDQLKASEELAKKIGDEQLAFAGANDEVSKLVGYYQNLIALRPELATAIQPLLTLLQQAASGPAATGKQTTAPTRDIDNPGANAGGGSAPAPVESGGTPGAEYRPPGIYDGQFWPGGIWYPGINGATSGAGSNGVTQINHFNGSIDPDEAITVSNQRLAQAVGW
jgi:hypothetical protein